MFRLEKGDHMNTAAGPKLKVSYQLKKKMIPWLFVLPGILITLVFRYYTMIQSFIWSFFNYDISNPPGTFVGLKNFQNLFIGDEFKNALINTLVYLVLGFVLTFWVPIVQALFLSQVKRGRNFFSTLYIIPAVIPGTVNIVIWKWIWQPEYGLANTILGFFNLPAQQWLSDPAWVKFCIIFPGILGGGLNVLLYLSAILGVSEDIMEASKIDCCTGLKSIWYMILPNIRFLVKIQLIMFTIGTLQIMDNIFQYTNGGPANASNSVALNIYKLYNERFDYGQGSAAAMLLLIMVAIITMIQMNLQNKNDD